MSIYDELDIDYLKTETKNNDKAEYNQLMEWLSLKVNKGRSNHVAPPCH